MQCCVPCSACTPLAIGPCLHAACCVPCSACTPLTVGPCLHAVYCVPCFGHVCVRSHPQPLPACSCRMLCSVPVPVLRGSGAAMASATARVRRLALPFSGLVALTAASGAFVAGRIMRPLPVCNALHPPSQAWWPSLQPVTGWPVTGPAEWGVCGR